MNTHRRGAAKRLIFSLAVASALGGCAVYGSGYPGYAVDPYGAQLNSNAPYYVGPPVSLGLWYGSGDGYRGHHGGWGGRHR